MWATMPWEARGRSGSAMGPIWAPAFNLTLRWGHKLVLAAGYYFVVPGYYKIVPCQGSQFICFVTVAESFKTSSVWVLSRSSAHVQNFWPYRILDAAALGACSSHVLRGTPAFVQQPSWLPWRVLISTRGY
jgi:hypothetical protein